MLIDRSIGEAIILFPLIRLHIPYPIRANSVATKRWLKKSIIGAAPLPLLLQSGIKLDTFLFMGGGRGPKY